MDNAAFDRLARLLGRAASRRHTVRTLVVTALAGGAAGEILAADGKQRRGKAKHRGDGSGRVGTERKGRKKGKKKKNQGGATAGGNEPGNASCAGTPLRPGQDFLGCDFSGRNLRGKDLHSSSFKAVDLSDADLCGADLESASFADSDLSDANLTGVNLDSSSHSKSSFAGANLTNATLRVATFSKVDYSGADFTGADLKGATFDEANLSGAVFCRTVRPDGRIDNRDCDLCANACGLCENCDEEDCAPPDCCPDPETGDGVCVDTQTSLEHCGGCNDACFTNLADACVAGECVCGDEPACSGGDTCCSSQCVDTDTSFQNCGGCGAGFACDSATADGCSEGECTCGNGSACDAGSSCVQGECVDECGGAQVLCDGICTPGVCCEADQTGPQCPAGFTCIAGGCVGEGQFRFVLRWGEEPSDLDTHVWLPAATPFHIAYFRQGSLSQFPFAELDIDDVTSFGPETVTIAQLFEGTYLYAVHLFSGSGTIGTSGAVVEVYEGAALVNTFPVPTDLPWDPDNGQNVWWSVFTLTVDDQGNTTITPVNTASGDPAPYPDSQLRAASAEKSKAPAVNERGGKRDRGRGKGKLRGGGRR